MIIRWTYIAAISAALAAAPIGFTSPTGLSQALAKSGGGNGGGNSGRDGNPGNSGKDNPGRSSDRNSGKGHDMRGHAAKSDDARDRSQAARTESRGRTQAATVRSSEVRSSDRARAEARSKAANELGNLNAAHASAKARANASPNSMVGRIGTYETNMHNALAIQDPAARAAAITAAREQLAQSANKPLTSGAVARVDGLLGIQGAPPQLGAVR